MLKAISTNLQVAEALMQRDLRARVGGKLVGFLLPMSIPFVHLGFLMVLYWAFGRESPLGTDGRVFFATGVLPYVMFAWPLRMLSRSLMVNRPLVSFPRIKMGDVIFAQAIVEVVSVSLIALLVSVVLLTFGVDLRPVDPALVLAGIYSSVALGVSFGWIHAIVSARFVFWQFIASATTSLFLVISGVWFFPDFLPDPLRWYVSFNPLLQAIELTRVGYYGNIDSPILAPWYPIAFAAALFAIALALEPALRRTILEH